MGVEVYKGAQARNIYNHNTGFEVAIDHYVASKVFNLRARHVIDASGQHAPSTKPTKVQLGLAAMYEEYPAIFKTGDAALLSRRACWHQSF